MRRRSLALTALTSIVVLTSGGTSGATGPPGAVTGMSPLAAGCNGETGPALLYANSEVQPQLSVDPRNPNHLVGTYQQDRWSDIASLAAVTVTSFDGGRTWTRAALPATDCAGGTVANGGDFRRVLDAWATVGPDGTAYATTLSLTGGLFAPDSEHAIQVTRSPDGGRTWLPATTIVRERGSTLNDYPSITADPTDRRFVYLVWCRYDTVDGQRVGPMHLSRSTDGGRTWEAPRPIYDAGPNSYTFAGRVEVLPDGTLVLPFSSIHEDPVTGARDVEAVVIRSRDKGRTWSAPSTIDAVRSVGARDPHTGSLVLDAGFLVHTATDGRGRIYVAWQDSRFTGGTHDAVVVTRSADGGHTWSPPVPVNRDTTVPAFSVSLAATRDGAVGVTYYDFRPNTPDPATLPTEARIVTSVDGGRAWTDRPLTGPFDLVAGPRAIIYGFELHFMGAQFGLVGTDSSFVSLFTRADAGPDNPDDLLVAQVSVPRRNSVPVPDTGPLRQD